jgi:mannose-6-phosphate isomerase
LKFNVAVSLPEDKISQTRMPGIKRLIGTVKHYDWGGYSFIPGLLGIDNNERQPYAEYWMGIHPQGISRVGNGPDEGEELTRYTTALPYLFKVLDVRNMLSIQVHPTRAAAEKEFERENAAGIPLDSPFRNYRDKNHKPELMVALSDFWLLHGFKKPGDLVYTLLNVVELRELLPIFNQVGYAGLYTYIMEMPQKEVNRLLRPLVENVTQIIQDSTLEGVDEDYWAAKAATLYNTNDSIDRGIFSIYLFNLVHLKKGQAIFQGAGVPHAYLEGQNVEIMANSDNVLRGGLTTKHIDVRELLKHIRCEPTEPVVIEGILTEGGERIYACPVTDFRLSMFELQKDQTVSFTSTEQEIHMLTEGKLSVNQDIILQPGNPSAFIQKGTAVNLKALENSRLFRSTPGW